MIDAGGQRGTFTVGPRGVVMPSPNAGSLMDFEHAVLRGSGAHPGLGAAGFGGLASGNSWSDDGQPPSAAQISQLAGAGGSTRPRFAKHRAELYRRCMVLPRYLGKTFLSYNGASPEGFAWLYSCAGAALLPWPTWRGNAVPVVAELQ